MLLLQSWWLFLCGKYKNIFLIKPVFSFCFICVREHFYVCYCLPSHFSISGRHKGLVVYFPLSNLSSVHLHKKANISHFPDTCTVILIYVLQFSHARAVDWGGVSGFLFFRLSPVTPAYFPSRISTLTHITHPCKAELVTAVCASYLKSQ